MRFISGGGAGAVGLLFVVAILGVASESAAHPQSSQASSHSIVLGAPLGARGTPKYVCLVQPVKCGWGTAAPHYLTLGGDPSGTITHVRWSTWGGPVATGRGLNWIFAPGGGYYPHPVAIELRAYDIGRCAPSGTTAYRRLVVCEPSHPAGPPGRWFGFSPIGKNWICGWR
jgi:hypothetical protein